MAYKDYEELNKRQQPRLRSRMGNSQAVSANQAQALRNPHYTTASGNTVQNSIRKPLGGGGIMDARGPAQRGKSFNIPRQQMYVKAPTMNLGAGGLALGAAQQMWNNPSVQRNNQNVENSLANMGGKTGIFGTPNNSVDLAGKAMDFVFPQANAADSSDFKKMRGGANRGEPRLSQLQMTPRENTGGRGRNKGTKGFDFDITSPPSPYGTISGRNSRNISRLGIDQPINTPGAAVSNAPQTNGQPPAYAPTLLEQSQGQINPEQAAELRGQQQGLPVPQAQSEFNQFGYHSSDPMSLLSREQLANMAMRKDLMTQQDLIQSDRDYHNFQEYGVTPVGAPLPMPRQGLQNYYGQQEVDLQRQQLGIDQQRADAQEAGMYAPQQPVMQTVQDNDGMEHVLSFDPSTGQRTNAARVKQITDALAMARNNQDEAAYKKLLRIFSGESPYDYKQYLSMSAE